MFKYQDIEKMYIQHIWRNDRNELQNKQTRKRNQNSFCLKFINLPTSDKCSALLRHKTNRFNTFSNFKPDLN